VASSSSAAVAGYRQCLARELAHHRAAPTGGPGGGAEQASCADALDVCATCFFVRYVLQRDAAAAGAPPGDFVRRLVRCITSCDSVAAAAAAATTTPSASDGSGGVIVLEYATSSDAWPRVQTCSRTLMLPKPPHAGDVAQSYAEFCRRMDLLVSETQIFIV
jgi:hypothetical protein